MQSSGASSIVVVGAGVSGLSCSLALAMGGHRVEIWARATPPNTTSDLAAAVWHPYLTGPSDKVAVWAGVSYRRFVDLLDVPAAGVAMREIYEFRRVPAPLPDWADQVSDLEVLDPGALAPGYLHGLRFAAPVVDTRRYLPYLMDELRARGVAFVQRDLDSLALALDAADVVVNCTGLSAGPLVGDERLVPIRGQGLWVENPGIDQVLLDEDDPAGITYVIPRGDQCVLGGSADAGRDDLAVDPDERDAVLARCVALAPALAGARVVRTVVGLRPGRDAVRLEAEHPRPGKTVVHDYGHGGAGITLSWGCAQEVRALVER
ncbi:FAD-dependent oxidoreductase [Haliangium sp.]|uniref:FAD-dependent oxidoreductase n=1 Tax=Haliangium sp. TaxID=2663208 RepID=UPI003D0B588A